MHPDGRVMDAVRPQVGLSSLMAFAPLSNRCVGAEKKKADSSDHNDDARDDESDPPCDMRGEASVNQRVENGRHQEICHTSASVSETCCESIRRADDVLVIETRRPHLARDKATTEDTDEEADCEELAPGIASACEEGGNCADKESSSECPARSKAIATWTGDQPNDQCGGKSNDIGVGNVHARQFEIRLNGFRELA